MIRKLNKTSTGIFLWLFDQAQKSGEDYIKIKNSDAFMPVSVEIQESYDDFIYGRAIKVIVEHNYIQEGDLMSDPRMDFLLVDNRTPDTPEKFQHTMVAVFPSLYVQHGLPVAIDRELIWRDSKEWMCAGGWQKDAAIFADQWMRNIADQQKIDKVAIKQLLTITNKAAA